VQIPASVSAPDTPPDSPEPVPSVRRWKRKLPWIGLAVLALVLDVVSKWMVFYPECIERGFHQGMVVGEVTSWWRTILVYNQGITFGMLPGAGAWILALGTGGVIALLVWKLWTLQDGRRLEAFALAIVIGGAIGNLYDRTIRTSIEADGNPGVRDFLDWYVPADTALGEWLLETFHTNHWYTSNVADVSIVCGVILLAWCILREPAEADERPKAEAGAAEVPTP
jgi:signal peptidase II